MLEKSKIEKEFHSQAVKTVDLLNKKFDDVLRRTARKSESSAFGFANPKIALIKDSTTYEGETVNRGLVSSMVIRKMSMVESAFPKSIKRALLTLTMDDSGYKRRVDDKTRGEVCKYIISQLPYSAIEAVKGALDEDFLKFIATKMFNVFEQNLGDESANRFDFNHSTHGAATHMQLVRVQKSGGKERYHQVQLPKHTIFNVLGFRAGKRDKIIVRIQTGGELFETKLTALQLAPDKQDCPLHQALATVFYKEYLLESWEAFERVEDKDVIDAIYAEIAGLSLPTAQPPSLSLDEELDFLEGSDVDPTQESDEKRIERMRQSMPNFGKYA